VNPAVKQLEISRLFRCILYSSWQGYPGFLGLSCIQAGRDIQVIKVYPIFKLAGISRLYWDLV